MAMDLLFEKKVAVWAASVSASWTAKGPFAQMQPEFFVFRKQ